MKLLGKYMLAAAAMLLPVLSSANHIDLTSTSNIQEAFSTAQDGDTIFITEDIYIEACITISGNKTLTISSKNSGKLYRNGDFASLINITDNATLNVVGLTIDGNLFNNYSTANGGLIYVGENATLTLGDGALLTNSTTDEGFFGSAVYALGHINLEGNASTQNNSLTNITLADNATVAFGIGYSGTIGLSVVSSVSGKIQPKVGNSINSTNSNSIADATITSDIDNHYVLTLTNSTHCWKYADNVYLAIFNGYQHSDTLAFFLDETFSAPEIPHRPGHNGKSWTPDCPFSMPANNLTFEAVYEQRLYNVEWGYVDDRTYGAGDPIKGATAIFYDDDSIQHSLSVIVTERSKPQEILTTYTEAGTYTAYADESTTGIDTNYHFNPLTLTATFKILPKPLSIMRCVVDSIKMYDGTDSAHVLSVGKLVGNIDKDTEVYVIATAHYNEITAGYNKTITVHFELDGSKSHNYEAPADSITTTRGKILSVVVLNPNAPGEGLDIKAEGYCASDVIAYELLTGEPTQFYLRYDETAHQQGFRDTGWIATDTSHNGIIPLIIPDGCHFGIYNANVQFMNEIGVESNIIPFSFSVNIPASFIKTTFNDVISYDLNNPALDSYQWYANDEAIPGATQSYWHEPDGLQGYRYYLAGTYNGQEVRSCVVKDQPIANDDYASLSVYPNPTADITKVEINSSATSTHSLQVVNSQGITVLQQNFTGNSYNLSLHGLAKGTYLIVVDLSQRSVVVKQ